MIEARCSRRPLLRGGLAVVVAGVSRRADAAGAVEVRARLEPRQLAVGEAAILTVEVATTAGGRAPEPKLPEALVRACEVVETGSRASFRSSFVNGRVAQESVVESIYQLIPRQGGELTFVVSADDGAGGVARSAQLVLTVAGATALAEPTDGLALDRPTRADADVFMWTSVDRAEVWVGQPLVYRLEVWERARFMNIQIRTLPTFQDFWMEELPDGTQRTDLVDGVPYRVHPGLARLLFPQRAGELQIGPAEALAGLRRRISGRAVGVRVRPLPAEGQPRGFSANNVGKYQISAAVDRPTVRQGEPLTLTLTVAGEGNLRFVEPGPLPRIEGARTYEPKVATDLRIEADAAGSLRPVGKRTYEILVIAERAGELQIPAQEFSFFDPWQGEYGTARSEPVRVTVEPLAGASPAVEPPIGEVSPDPQADGSLLPPVVDADLTRGATRDPWLTPKRWIAGMVSLPLILGSTVLAGRMREVLAGDQEARERARRRTRRNQLLATAKRSVESGAGFHAVVAQLLQELAQERAGGAGTGLARPALLRLLRSSGVGSEDVDCLDDLLGACDAARFGASSASREDRARLLEQCVALVAALGRGGRG